MNKKVVGCSLEPLSPDVTDVILAKLLERAESERV
jgi:hypothetical protein